jgi:hypothetical protein
MSTPPLAMLRSAAMNTRMSWRFHEAAIEIV